MSWDRVLGLVETAAICCSWGLKGSHNDNLAGEASYLMQALDHERNRVNTLQQELRAVTENYDGLIEALKQGKEIVWHGNVLVRKRRAPRRKKARKTNGQE